MPPQDLVPAPRGRLEKLHDANLDGYLVFVLVAVAVFPLQESIGFWPVLVLFVMAGGAGMLLAHLIFRPVQRKRTASDARRGIFECALRTADAPAPGKWAFGYAKAERGRLLFQAKAGFSGSVAGRVEVHPDPRPAGPVVNAPWLAFPGGKAITLHTGRGLLEVAASASSLELLIDQPGP